MPRRIDDDSGEFPRPRRKGSLLWLWLLLGGAGVPVVGCCGCVGTLALMGQKRIAEDEAATVQLTPGQEHRVGDVGVTVTGCTEGEVYGKSPGGTQIYSKHPYTVVTIALKNYNPAKNAHIGAQSGAAVATDDLGNTLADIAITTEFGFEVDINGQINRGYALELRSDQAGEDKLVLTRTVPAAKTVTVKLDATRYGGRGKLVVTLPIAKPQPPPATYPRAKFEQMVKGKTAAEIESLVGKPNETDTVKGEVVWRYFNRIDAAAMGGPVHENAVITFGADGKAERVDPR